MIFAAALLAAAMSPQPDYPSRLWCICEGLPSTYQIADDGRLIWHRNGVVQFSCRPTEKEKRTWVCDMFDQMNVPGWKISSISHSTETPRVAWTVSYTQASK